ncbi:hypothetical protein [Streptacidiphilus albus]|uniref:hypothetical protein n=1 Tax=Streptacidiphilus albus TaxID=105425 RepID=UPI00128E418C|nr:hypothetical protein [Streptacidiphilus albus]
MAEILQQLLLDLHDTGVTQGTANALLQRQDSYGLRLVLAAFARSREPSFPEPSTVDHLYSAIMGDLRWMTETGESQLVSQLEELTLDADDAVRVEARKLLSPSRGFNK